MRVHRYSFSASGFLVLGLATFGLMSCGSAGGNASGGNANGGNGAGTGGSLGTPDASIGGGGAGTGGSSGSGGGSGGTGGSGTGGSRDASSAGTGGAPRVDAGSGGTAGGGAARDAGAVRDTGISTVDAGSTCPGMLRPGDNNESITSGGEMRTFIVHIPTGYTGSSPVSVVLDFHPLGGTGGGQEGSSGWRAKCDSVGCIAVFPDSSGRAGDNSWNAGYCCTNAEANRINDVQFARDMIAWLETHTCVDAKRIYASGGSNGGGMSYRLACEAADVIAAVAPVDFRCVTGTDPLANAGQVTAENNTACTCNLPRPIAVVAYDEGQDNTVVPYNGGQTPNLRTDCPPNASCVGIGFSSAMVNFQTWARFDQCTGSAATDPNNALCQTYTTCAGSTQVTLCTVPEAGHLSAYGNAQARVTDTAWNVFRNQALP